MVANPRFGTLNMFTWMSRTDSVVIAAVIFVAGVDHFESIHKRHCRCVPVTSDIRIFRNSQLIKHGNLLI